MGREVGGRFKREGTYAHLWLIHVDVWQKPTQYYKTIILQLKINTFKKNAQQMKYGRNIPQHCEQKNLTDCSPWGRKESDTAE